MNYSDNKNGFTKVDHVTFDILLPLLSTSAQSIFLRIYRQTWGWNKQTDNISNSQFSKFCRIKNHETIKAAVRELIELDIITVTGKITQIKEYGIKWSGMDVIRQKYLEELENDE